MLILIADSADGLAQPMLWLQTQQLCQSQGVVAGGGNALCGSANVKRAMSIAQRNEKTYAREPDNKKPRKAKGMENKCVEVPNLKEMPVADAHSWAENNLPSQCKPSACGAKPDNLKWSWSFVDGGGSVRVVVNLRKKNFYIYKPKVPRPNVAWQTCESVEQAWDKVRQQCGLA